MKTPKVQRVQDPSQICVRDPEPKNKLLPCLDLPIIKGEIQSHHIRVHNNGSKSARIMSCSKFMLWLRKFALMGNMTKDFVPVKKEEQA